MVIEEPAPPEPPPAPPAETPAPKETPPPHHHVVRKEPPASTPENTPETVEPLPQVPSLEPHESSMEQASLHREIEGLQDDVRERITKLSHAGLSGVNRKTLDDARTFFRQSTQALDAGDLQRALTLARKASLLLSALEH
jgi:hypothetical protein